MTNSILFGTDGWRGLIAEEFTFANLRRVAHAAAKRFKRDSLSAPIAIGYDRRFLSPQFARCVADVFASEKLSVVLSKTPMSTPALSVYIAKNKMPWGIMITASHNPAGYNGFKIKEGSGRSAPPQITTDIEHLISEDDVITNNCISIPTFDCQPVYDRFLRNQLDWKALKRLRGTIVVDYLFGSGAGILERLLDQCPVSMLSLHDQHDPNFGDLHPEPIEPFVEELKSTVRKNKGLVGIALDGDADRIGIVDDRGSYLTPHQVFPLLALHAIEHRGARGKLIQAVSLGVLGERIAKTFNLQFEEVPVGFKHVAERMVKEKVAAGGEESGGFAFAGGLPERDGVLNGLLFLEMLAVRGKKTSALVADMEERFGQVRFKRVDFPLANPFTDKAAFTREVNARLPKRIAGMAISEVRTQDGIKLILSSGAWVLLRPSGTEPLLRTYAESDSWERTHQLLAWAKTISTSLLPAASYVA